MRSREQPYKRVSQGVSSGFCLFGIPQTRVHAKAERGCGDEHRQHVGQMALFARLRSGLRSTSHRGSILVESSSFAHLPGAAPALQLNRRACYA